MIESGNSSRWFKFDFHTHTPASSDYKEKYETTEDWLSAAMSAQVDCVAITDHVSGDWIDRLKETYSGLSHKEWFRPLTIFPGVEITVSTGQSRVHVLAIFDPTATTAKITAVLGQCGITSGHGDAESTFSSESIERIIDIVSTAGGVTIPAHIDGRKGLFHGITNTNQEIKAWLKKVNCAEFLNLAFLEGVNPELQNDCKNLGKIQGSDAHKSSALGRRFTWIKMGKPSVSALRLALHDHVFCVKNQDQNPNLIPGTFIQQLTVDRMNHCGRIPGKPEVFELCGQFNAIIGGRGSGKSTFIESLRLALGRLGDLEDLPSIKKEVTQFINGVTGPETRVTAEVRRREEVYETSWSDNSLEEIRRRQDDHWVDDYGTADERFYVSLFSQKQINALANNSNSLLDIVDRSPIVGMSEWKMAWDAELEFYLNVAHQIRNLEKAIDRKGVLKGQLEDVKNDIESFEKGGHETVFKNYQKYSLIKNKLKNTTELDVFLKDLQEVSTRDIPEEFILNYSEDDAPEISKLREIAENSQSQISRLRESLKDILKRLEQARKERNTLIEDSDWMKKCQSVEIAYNNIVDEYKDKGEEFDPGQYEFWIAARTKLSQQLDEIEKNENLLVGKITKRRNSLFRLYKLRRVLQIRRTRFISEVLADNEYVRMTLKPFADTASIEKHFRSSFGIESAFARWIYQEGTEDSLLYSMFDSATDFKEIIRRTAALKSKVQSLSKSEDFGEQRVDARLKNTFVQKATQQPEIFDRFDAWFPDDLLVVEYARDPKKSKFESIEKGSAGQKAATILAFLLSHGDNPIVVDQPEDDLDNALVYSLIVSQIHKNKGRRQIIMVTHNPNIVVNGDAELINVLEFKNGQIQVAQTGGLADSAIRESICDIMEGGTEAFEKRYKRMKL